PSLHHSPWLQGPSHKPSCPERASCPDCQSPRWSYTSPRSAQSWRSPVARTRHLLRHRSGVQPSRGNLSLKRIFGKRVHLEIHVLSRLDRAHIAFVGAHVHLHLGQVLRNGEKRRSLQ